MGHFCSICCSAVHLQKLTTEDVTQDSLTNSNAQTVLQLDPGTIKKKPWIYITLTVSHTDMCFPIITGSSVWIMSTDISQAHFMVQHPLKPLSANLYDFSIGGLKWMDELKKILWLPLLVLKCVSKCLEVLFATMVTQWKCFFCIFSAEKATQMK